MSYEIVVAPSAKRDLREIGEYIATHDSPGKAVLVLEKIERAVASLARTPNRGVHPPEEIAFGIRNHREIFFKPYRIFYQVQGKRVFIKLISDGRRDMRALFQRRLLAP
jgi:toxin ParE1/3/4